jgi:chitin deacetylase
VSERVVALTFDDGPSAAVTPRVLDALRSAGARATFFVLGREASRRPELIRRIVREGHAIGSHSYSHPLRVGAAEAETEIAATERAIAAVGAGKPALFRPPFGAVRSPLTRAAARRGYAVVTWTITGADTHPGITAGAIADNLIHTPYPGDIALIHDGAGHGRTADALPRVLSELGAKGWRFVTVPELLDLWDRRLGSAPSVGRGGGSSKPGRPDHLRQPRAGSVSRS